MSERREVLDRLRTAVVVAVLRAPDAAKARRAVAALVAGGIESVEVTYTTPDAAEVIAWAVREYGDRIVAGAGTLTDPAQMQEAVDAGARFLVSPGNDGDVTDAMVATGLLSMPGALTPTEVMAVARRGDVDVVKLFPGSLGGPAYLKALRGPFPHLTFMPTGGVSPATLGDWLAAGAVAVGAGGELCPAAAIAADRYDELTERAATFVATVRAHQNRSH